MKQQKGFTLIELIMVIVILGILAAFALPRFADLSGSAETATVEGARASVQSSSGIVRAQALVENKANTTGTDELTIEGVGIDLTNGYLAATSVEDMAQLGDFDVTVNSGVATVTLNATPTANEPCFTFTDSTAQDTPPVTSVVLTWDEANSACN